jgi:hypothetical protein
MEPAKYSAQVIACGGWSLAVSMGWASNIVDTFELAKIPRAPNWLIGAVNIDGYIVPVVDLAVYFVPNTAPAEINRHHRLLVGCQREENTDTSSGNVTANSNSFAILFSGLPIQIEYTREEIDFSLVIPERLRELSLGLAKNNLIDANGVDDKVHFEMDTARFVDFLTNSLI